MLLTIKENYLKMNNEEKMIAELMELGFSPKHKEREFLLYEAQLWLMTKGFHIAPRIYLYHDINLDEQTSWECTVYAEWAAIFTVGKILTFHDALALGISEALKVMKG